MKQQRGVQPTWAGRMQYKHAAKLFATTDPDTPYDEEDLRRRLGSTTRPNMLGIIEGPGQVAAAILAEDSSDMVEILWAAVALPYRRKGYGKALLAWLSTNWILSKPFLAQVHESNIGAQAMFKAAGFRADLSVLRITYPDRTKSYPFIKLPPRA